MKINATILLLVTLFLNEQPKHNNSKASEKSKRIEWKAIFDSSKITTQTDRIVQEIIKINVVMGSSIGEAGHKPKQYDNFINLKNKASLNELLELTNHPNGVVRCYTFWALSYNDSIDLFSLILKHINDNEIIKTQFGCIGSDIKVGDFFIEILTRNYLDENSHKFDSVQQLYLDSVLIYTPNDLDAKSSAIYRAEPTEKLYAIIRSLVIEDSDQTALILLAKYQKEQDIDIILKSRYLNSNQPQDNFYTYRAISYFPNPAFLPFLEESLQKILLESHYSNEWQELYLAIASYKNKKSLKLLEIPYSRMSAMREYHMRYVFNAIRNFKAPIYDELFLKIWRNDDKITNEVFDYLIRKYPDSVITLTKKSLQNTEKLYVANIDFNNYDDSINIVTKMLDLVIVKDKEFAKEVIRKNIKDAIVHVFNDFADKVVIMKDTSFVEPLIARLKTEDNPHIYLRTTEVLIAYKDKKINQRILNTMKMNHNLTTDWGGVALSKLLKKDGLL